jgi:succinate dehydrogenase/fumarate reductase flavoprotein subunit
MERYMPGSIAVGPDGKRFVSEGDTYVAFVDAMHLKGYGTTHLIADHKFIRQYGLGMCRPFPFSPRPWLKNGYLTTAPTIRDLAAKIGVDADGLAATVERFNQFAVNGQDPDFHCGEDPMSRFKGDHDIQPNPAVAPIGDGPYYAITLHAGSLSTFMGLETNADAQVLGKDGEPIPGLYACGLDMNHVFKGVYPAGGCSLGPIMTFGYVAARHIAASGGNGTNA